MAQGEGLLVRWGAEQSLAAMQGLQAAREALLDLQAQSNKQTLNQNAKRYALLPAENFFLTVFFTVYLGIVHVADCFTVLMTGQLLVACQLLCNSSMHCHVKYCRQPLQPVLPQTCSAKHE